MDPSASAADAAQPALGATPSPSAAQTALHIPWTFDQFSWDSAALKASAQAALGLTTAGAAGAPPAWPECHAERSGGGPTCQVCHAELGVLKEYYQRYKICPEHCTMPCIVRDGLHQRFCQQCGKFQPLEDFDGDRRTCRRKLQRHNERRRKLTSQKKGAQGGAAAASSPSSPGGRPRRSRATKRAAATGGDDEESGGTSTGNDATCVNASPLASPTHAAAKTDTDQRELPPGMIPIPGGTTLSPPSLPLLPQELASLLLPWPQSPPSMPAPSLAAPPPEQRAAPQPAPTVVPAATEPRMPRAPGMQSGQDFDALIADLFGAAAASPPSSRANAAWLEELLLPSPPRHGPLPQPPPPPPQQQQQRVQQEGGGGQAFLRTLPPGALAGAVPDSLSLQQAPLGQHAALAGFAPLQAGPPQSGFAAGAPTSNLSAYQQQGTGASSGAAAVRELSLGHLAVMPQPAVRSMQPYELLQGCSLQQALDMIQRQQAAALAQPVQQPAWQLVGQGLLEQARSVRLSIKLFSVTPDQLPLELRRELSVLLQSPNLEGYLRPGCVHLTIDALLTDSAGWAALQQGGVAVVVEGLLRGDGGLPGLGGLLRSVPALVQMEGQAVLVEGGRVVRLLRLDSCHGVMPCIASLAPLALHTGRRPQDSVLVRGRGLVGRQQRLLVRAGGLYPLVEVLSSCSPAPAPPGSAAGVGNEEWVEIRLPELEQGLVSVERGALLSGSRVLLALEDAAAVAELCQLERSCAGVGSVDGFLRRIALVLQQRRSQDQRRPCSADDEDGSPEHRGKETSRLAAAAAAAARAGVVVAALRDWPAVAALLLPSVAAGGSSAEDAVHDMDALCPPGSSLLHVAAAAGSAAVLQVLAGWSKPLHLSWDVARAAGPAGLTPLHLAAAARNAPLVQALHDMNPAAARIGWHTACTTDGLTPAAFAAAGRALLAFAAAEAAGDGIVGASDGSSSGAEGGSSCTASTTSLPSIHSLRQQEGDAPCPATDHGGSPCRPGAAVAVAMPQAAAATTGAKPPGSPVSVTASVPTTARSSSQSQASLHTLVASGAPRQATPGPPCCSCGDEAAAAAQLKVHASQPLGPCTPERSPARAAGGSSGCSCSCEAQSAEPSAAFESCDSVFGSCTPPGAEFSDDACSGTRSFPPPQETSSDHGTEAAGPCQCGVAAWLLRLVRRPERTL